MYPQEKTLFPETLETCNRIIIDIRKEAEFERWEGVKPENFYIKNDNSGVFLCLDYIDEGLFEMQFRIGVSKNGFAAPNPIKYIDITYDFVSLSHNERIKNYYIDENLEFCKYADFLLDIPFKWKALLFHSEDGAFINTMRDRAFQKFCLFLDIMIPLKNEYTASKTLITDSMKSVLDDLKDSFDFEVEENQEPNYIFTHGHYKMFS